MVRIFGCFRYPPFNAQSDEEIIQEIIKGNLVFDPEEWASVSDEAKDLVKKMLTRNPKHRISAVDALAHPWIGHRANIKKESAASMEGRKAFTNLKHFSAKNKMKTAVILYMGSKLLTKEETLEMEKVFRSMDKDGNGLLDRNELIAGYSKIKNGRSAPKDIAREVDAIFEKVDMDKSGFIEFSEFISAAIDQEDIFSIERIKAAFKLFDKDNTGQIDKAEIMAILGQNVDISSIDTDGDGKIDFEEFKKMLVG